MRLLQLLALPALLRETIAYTKLSEDSLRSIPFPGADFDIHNQDGLLAPILIPRVPGTEGSHKVLQHFVDFFSHNLPEWKLEFQNSTSTTPTSGGKQVPFRNLIATRDPPWVSKDGEVGRLALVAHYDSKLTPSGFIGATDSAAPCAMLLHAAKTIDAGLTAKWSKMQAEEMDEFGDVPAHKGIQILLLDGEEAFATWTHEDSIYGARALAEEWESSFHPAASTYQTPLHSIDLFVLLDLLGAKDPVVPSYFKTTHWAYQHLADVEARMHNTGGILKSNRGRRFLPEAFKTNDNRWIGGMIEDDHLPFLLRGVEVLHIIPTPFPHVWHTMDDDGEHLDIPTCEDWAVITAAFAAEWMDLEGFLQSPAKSVKRSLGEDEKSEL